MDARASAIAVRDESCVGDEFAPGVSRLKARRFWMRNSGCAIAAALLVTLSSTALVEPLSDVAPPTGPEQKKPVVLARARRQSVASPKKARLWMPRTGRPETLDLVERMGDGSMSQTSYFDISLDLNENAPGSATSSASAVAQVADTGSSPFDLVLKDALDARQLVRHSGLGYAADAPKAVPAADQSNVTVTPAQEAMLVKRIISLPVQAERLRDIKGVIGVSEEDFAQLASGLGADVVRKGEQLDLIIGQRPAQPDLSEILFARHMATDGRERLLARCDDGHFQLITDHRPYDRMVAEALAHQAAEARSGPAQAVPKDVAALQDAAADYPKLIEHLARRNVPVKVSLQIVQLLRANGIHWSKTADVPQLDFVFRTAERGEQELVSVTLKGKGRDRRFYRYVSDSGKPEFFDDAGRSVSKTLMHKPVSAGQLGDGFGWRVHPILRTRKFHNGVDYRAPMGSPIVAAGDGVVVKIDSEGGYGKYIRIQHDGGYTTTYAHIEGTPKGLTVGDHVAQGQVIAYVGSTGLSTGPHLYYELRVGDTYKDPTKAEMPAGTTLRGRALEEFRQQIGRVETIASTIRATATSAAHSAVSALTPGGDKQ
ncbi:M23 family metallopeptidase [Rhizobium lemnae]|uniref:M23 family metallopeptidase n=1 Tax=Rhizobium lemnae TaxID=1214924 RepID=A0ABV8EDW4_9HYPH|nr:M23 family metallopeptidase [Rhizobium lemnae]MCJ8510114.1 M23 family metallopeptidase [Rhizobium lemnae]